MRLRHLQYLAGAVGLTLLAMGCSTTKPAVQAPTVQFVRSGESIQQAVDRARSGDTVSIPAGTYHESVEIKTDGVTLRGAGGGTVITSGGKGACASGGYGICITGTDQHRLVGVSIRDLTVKGFKKDGIRATGTEGLVVRDVTARNNGEHGIMQQKSVRGLFRGNTALDNAESGIFLANTVEEEGGATDAEGTLVTGNRLGNNRIGITVRRLRNVSVDHNTITGNCGGVFVVGDEGKPRAGHLTVSNNNVYENNKSCPATTRLPAIQGAGVVLTGVEDTRVTGNTVRDNKGSTPMSGGIVLYPSFVGVANSANVISGNTAQGNKPVDLANREKGATPVAGASPSTSATPSAGMSPSTGASPSAGASPATPSAGAAVPATGAAQPAGQPNVFISNQCTASEPAGSC